MNQYKVIEYDVHISPDKLIAILENAIGEDILRKTTKFGVGLSFATGSGGLSNITKAKKVETDKDSRRITIKSDREYSVELSYLQILDSGQLEARTYRGYPLTSYDIQVIWGTEPIAVLKTKKYDPNKPKLYIEVAVPYGKNYLCGLVDWRGSGPFWAIRDKDGEWGTQEHEGNEYTPEQFEEAYQKLKTGEQ